MRKGKLEGVADKAAPENGPLCDRKRPFSLSVITGIIAESLKLRSTLEAASCCHPVRHAPGSNSIRGRRACTMQNSMPRKWFEIHHT